MNHRVYVQHLPKTSTSWIADILDHLAKDDH